MNYIIIFLIALIIISRPLHAIEGISFYMPPDSRIQNDIDKLLVLANAPSAKKPVSVSLIKKYLPMIREKYPELYERIVKETDKYNSLFAVTTLSGDVSIENGDSKAIPNNHGIDTGSNYKFSGEAIFLPSKYTGISAGGFLYDDNRPEYIPAGAYISMGIEYLQIDAGYRERWYSPFQSSSYLLSSQARPTVSAGISNSMPLTPLCIQYEIFTALLSEVPGIRSGNRIYTGRPKLLGMHLSLMPLPWWTVGFNRTLQFSGRKNEISANDIWLAIINPVKKDNKNSPGFDSDDPNYEFGNQQASVTSSMNFSSKIPMSLYFEYAGEDTAQHENYRLGNVAFSAGIFVPYLLNNLSFTYEFSEWQSAWYVHHLFEKGYTNNGNVMGHWAGDERIFNDAAGGQAHMIKSCLQITSLQYLTVVYRIIINERYSKINYATGHECELEYGYDYNGHIAGIDVYTGRSVLKNKFINAGIFLKW